MKSRSVGVRVKANVKAGGTWGQHNRRAAKLVVRSGIKAGGWVKQHNRSVAIA